MQRTLQSWLLEVSSPVHLKWQVKCNEWCTVSCCCQHGRKQQWEQFRLGTVHSRSSSPNMFVPHSFHISCLQTHQPRDGLLCLTHSGWKDLLCLTCSVWCISERVTKLNSDSVIYVCFQDPVILSCVLSCISALLPYITQAADILPDVVNKVSNLSLLWLDGLWQASACGTIIL